MDHELDRLMKAASERQLAVTQFQEKYAHSQEISTEQLVSDMRELQASERVFFDAIVTMFVAVAQATPATAEASEFS